MRLRTPDKRGLPHAHFIIWLSPEDVPKTPEQIDKIVTCQIPNPITEPKLHKLVMTKMTHGPCGGDGLDVMKGGSHSNIDAFCLKADKGDLTKSCQHGYPKSCQPHTIFGENSRPIYARPSPEHGGFTGIVYCRGCKKDVLINNCYTVPHNRYLLAKYKCHINVGKHACVFYFESGCYCKNIFQFFFHCRGYR